MLRHYPAKVRDWIASKGGLTDDLIVLSGAALRSIFRPCR